MDNSSDFADVIREAMAEQTFGDQGEVTITKVVTTLHGHNYHLSNGEVFAVIVRRPND